MPRHNRPNLGVDRLEGRLLPTAAPYPDAARTALHDSYVAEAEQGPSNVVFLGDSITYLWGDDQRPSLGSASWQADFGTLGAENFGVSGDVTQNLLDRVQDGELAGQPKVAVVLIGINDLLGGESPAQTAQGVASVVASIHAESPNSKVLLLGILPTAGAALNAEIAQTNVQLATIPDLKFLDLGPEFLGAGDVDKPGLLAFGVHPDAAGYAIIARAIDAPIRDLLDPPVAPSPSTATTQPTAASVSAPPSPDLLIPIVVTTADASTPAPSTTSTVPRKTSLNRSVSPTP